MVYRVIVKGHNQRFSKTLTAYSSEVGKKIYHQTDMSLSLKWLIWGPRAFDVFILTRKRRKFWETLLVNMLALIYRDVVLDSFYSLFRFSLRWLSVRSTSLFVLVGKHARMGTCKVESDKIVWPLPIAFHIQLLHDVWPYFWRRSWFVYLFPQFLFQSRLHVQSAERLHLWKHLCSFIPGRIVSFQSGWSRNVLRRSVYFTR